MPKKEKKENTIPPQVKGELARLLKEEGYGVVHMPRKDRVKGVYNQSHSPFGLADEVRGINIK